MGLLMKRKFIYIVFIFLSIVFVKCNNNKSDSQITKVSNKKNDKETITINDSVEIIKIYEGGYLLDSSTFTNGKRNGICFHHNLSTGEYQLVEYSNGVKDGQYISYYKNGNVSNEGQYYNNIPLGDWIVYYEDGEIEKYFYQNKKSILTMSLFNNGKLDSLIGSPILYTFLDSTIWKEDNLLGANFFVAIPPLTEFKITVQLLSSNIDTSIVQTYEYGLKNNLFTLFLNKNEFEDVSCKYNWVLSSKNSNKVFEGEGVCTYGPPPLSLGGGPN